MTRDMIVEAKHRMSRVARRVDALRTVEGADQRTSASDARIALCIASGIALDDIDPSSGHDMSRASYESVRASWRRIVQEHGWSEFFDRPVYEEVIAWWTERRPEFVDGDDWLAGLLKEDPP